MTYTYVLVSINGKKTYSGVTNDINRRVKEHNAGKVKFSRSYRPFELLLCEEYSTNKGAIQREKFYKSTSGRRELKLKYIQWSVNNRNKM